MELEEPYGQILIGLSAFVLCLSVLSWSQVLPRLLRRQSVIPYAVRRPVPWGLPAIVLFIMALMIAALTVQGVASVLTATWDLGPAGPQLVAMVSFSISSLLALVVSLLVVWRLGAKASDFGLTPSVADISRGALAFGVLAPMVYAIQAVLSRLWKSSEHPIIDLVGDNPSPLFFAVLSVSAVVVAPLVEEFFFRVLLQGWFENLAVLYQEGGSDDLDRRQRLWFGRGVVPAPLPGTPPASPEAEADVTSSEHPATAARAPSDLAEDDEATDIPGPTWPVLASALLFALAHAGYGPDPIPLFVLALGLGYLYRRTHRVWPCVILHMLVNGTSMVMLWAMVRGGAEL